MVHTWTSPTAAAGQRPVWTTKSTAGLSPVWTTTIAAGQSPVGAGLICLPEHSLDPPKYAASLRIVWTTPKNAASLRLVWTSPKAAPSLSLGLGACLPPHQWPCLGKADVKKTCPTVSHTPSGSGLWLEGLGLPYMCGLTESSKELMIKELNISTEMF